MGLGFQLSQLGSGLCAPNHYTKLLLLIVLVVLGKAICSHFNMDQSSQQSWDDPFYRAARSRHQRKSVTNCWEAKYLPDSKSNARGGNSAITLEIGSQMGTSLTSNFWSFNCLLLTLWQLWDDWHHHCTTGLVFQVRHYIYLRKDLIPQLLVSPHLPAHHGLQQVLSKHFLNHYSCFPQLLHRGWEMLLSNKTVCSRSTSNF